jgi:3-deoxy-7-phosphoheptulonate synthase
MLLDTAHAVREAGAVMLRGGAYKPRTSPYDFQGLGEAALDLLAEARAATGLPVVTEIMDPRQLARIERAADVLQVGARNMQNYSLLAEVGQSRKPVLLKRGLSATIRELLLAAEYILAAGNPNVILCERGIRTFETATRNTLDVAAVPVLKAETHLPVIVDPSHAGGRAELVVPLALAAVAAGADGLIVEVHPCPGEAKSDGDQSLTPAAFAELVRRVEPVARAVGRRLSAPRAPRARQREEAPCPA